VRLPHLDLKLADGAYDEGGKQRGAVSAVEAVEGASEAIVAEEVGLAWLEAKVFGDAAGGPLGEPVERAALQQEVGNEGTESDGGGDVFGAPAGRWQVSREEGLELQAAEEATDDGCGADFEGFEEGLVERGGHRCLGVGDVGREGCYRGRREGGKQIRGSKKIPARLQAARASLAGIFLLVKARGRERSAG
jgi:hypothetical protein